MPVRSSIVPVRYGSPFFVNFFAAPVRIPPTVTCAPPSRPPRPDDRTRPASASARSTVPVVRSASIRSSPNSGWSDTYSPSISRSAASFSRLSNSSSGTGTSSNDAGVAPAPSMAPSASPNVAPSTSPNSENCPSLSARRIVSACSQMRSVTASRPLRG